MSGLDEEQLSELECRVSELLEEPWDKEEGRPRELALREALVVTCGYMRQNIIEDVWADIFDVAQSTISRYITFLTPFVEKATEKDRPAAEDAAEATRNAIALVDGTLWPCWSWDGESRLWSGKYKTTGHGSLIVTNLQGRITFVSEPVTGNRHDMAKLKGSAVEKILKKAGGVFGDKGFIVQRKGGDASILRKNNAVAGAGGAAQAVFQSTVGKQLSDPDGTVNAEVPGNLLTWP